MMRFNFTKKNNKKEVMQVIDLENAMAEDEAKKKAAFKLFQSQKEDSSSSLSSEEKEILPAGVERSFKNG